MGVNISTRLILTALLITANLHFTFAEGDKDINKGLKKSSAIKTHTYFNINNISTLIYNDGDADNNLNGNSGFEFPKGSGKALMYESGFMWGGKVNNEIRAGGSFYWSLLVPGRKLPGNVYDEKYGSRIYRVREDYKSSDLGSEIADGEGTAEEIRWKYEKDWKEWPADDGAPYDDKNHNGRYEPETDIPGVPGAAQTIWFIASEPNDSLNLKLLGSKSLGIEMQVTVWGYKTNGILDNMLFKSYRLINKGSSRIDSMYASIVCDPDLGDAGDDHSGCDTLLNLGFIYNYDNNDVVYKPTPPSAGFRLLQGPRVKALPYDSAVFLGRKIPGYKNLQMTAFRWGFKASSYENEITFSSDFKRGALQLYYTMQGLTNSGLPWLLPASLGGGPTKFLSSGDPVTGTGFLEEMIQVRGDKRLGIHSGPFEMAVGDTQEIVFAEIAAGGPLNPMSNLQAITELKKYSNTAALAYNSRFNIPSAPPHPRVVKGEMDKEIVLDWGSDAQAARETENYSIAGYNFEGYNVYQLPRADSKLSEAKRIATFDKVNGIKSVVDAAIDSASGVVISKVYHYGTDSGIIRFLKINHDYITKSPLSNGKQYYYAVTSYCVSVSPVFGNKSFESIPKVIEVNTHSADPGVRFGASYGDLIPVQRLSGRSDGTVSAYVIDPARLSGHTYKVTFENNNGALLWKLTDLTANEIMLEGQANQSGDNNYFTVDGILLKVSGPKARLRPNQMYWGMDSTLWGWNVISGTRKWTWTSANVSGYKMETFGMDSTNNCISTGSWWGTSLKADQYRNILIKFASTDTSGNILNASDPNVSYAYRYMQGCQNPPVKPEFAQYIINKSASYDFQDFRKNFPFAAFDTEVNPARRLAVGYLENNSELGTVNGKYWPPSSANINLVNGNSTEKSPREWFFIFDADYKETPDPALTANIGSNAKPLPLMYIGMPNWKGPVPFSSNDQLILLVNHPNTENDSWQFTAPSIILDKELAKQDVESINVYPNPYYAQNPQERNKYQRFVTFNHLPEKATIRVFNLAGELVRTIRKSSYGQSERWDLLTEAGYQAGSGLYIVHIDMPELGKSKVLKLAVIQETIIPDHF